MRENRFYGVSLLLLRFGAGIILFTYGYFKLFGNGYAPDQVISSYNATIQGLQKAYGIPPVLGTLSIAAEFLGGLGFIVGLLGRLAAFGVCCNMSVATYVSLTGTIQQFKLKQIGNVEAVRNGAFPALILIIALVILLNGSGVISIDHMLRGKRKRY